MKQGLRFLVGLATPVALFVVEVALLPPGTSGEWAVLSLVAWGFVGGLILRSWWAIGLVPLAILAAVPVRLFLETGGIDLTTNLDTESTRDAIIFYLLWLAQPAALGAALGSILSKALVAHRTRDVPR